MPKRATAFGLAWFIVEPNGRVRIETAAGRRRECTRRFTFEYDGEIASNDDAALDQAWKSIRRNEGLSCQRLKIVP